MRLDVYLAQKKICRSREAAKSVILSGGVEVNGKTLSKPSADVTETDKVTVSAKAPKYVGRGGLKLEKALDSFNISVQGLVCADIGASTGGFTDCMLQRGAEYVYAVDVGHGQLDLSLVNDSRVKNMEGVNVKELVSGVFDRDIDFICADISFISLTKAIPVICSLLPPDGQAVMLVKPQFECGRADIGKGGVVRSADTHRRVLEQISAFAVQCGMGIRGMDFSPVKGGSGNIEYLIYGIKGAESRRFSCAEIVERAWKSVQ